MKFDDLHVVAATSWLPERMTLEEADRAGLCSARALWRTDIAAVCVSDTASAPAMAAEAAGAAVRRAGCRPDEIDLLLHASTSYQGHDMWPAASYVQRVGVGNRCPAIDVSQMSNGGMAAMDLAAAYLMADPGRSHALVTTGDRFCLPGFDRWRSDPGTICGDGGAAVLLSRRPGFARIRSIVTVSDPELERMARGDDPFGTAPFSVRPTVDLETTRRALVADVGLDAVLDRIDAGQRETFDRALSEADTKLADIDCFVVPSLGLGRLKAHFLDPFGIDPDRTSWSRGRQIGHMGAGDQIALLGLLADSGELRPGQRCLLAGVGQGFSWSAAVVEMLHAPVDPTR